MANQRETKKPIRHVYKGVPGMTDLHEPGTVRFFTSRTTELGGPRRNGWIREDEPKSAPKQTYQEEYNNEDGDVVIAKPKRTYNKKK